MAVGQVVYDRTVEVQNGREWWETFNVYAPGVINVTAQSDVAFYIGIFNPDEFERARTANPARFPFLIGSARQTHYLRYNISPPGHLVVIIRVSQWAGRSGVIHVVVQLQR